MFARRLLTSTFAIIIMAAFLLGPLPAPVTRAATPAATVDPTSKGAVWHLGKWWDSAAQSYNWTGIESDLNDLQRGNITWIKAAFTRATAYSVYDRLIPLLQARNIDLEGLIISPRKYYLATDEAYKADYKNWLATLINKYKGYIKYWEIHNEPNLHYYWNIDEYTTDNVAYANSVKDYVAQLKDSYETIKANDPTAKVIIGGLASWKVGRFMDELIKQNAHQYFDIMGYHPYPDWTRPNPDGVVDQVNNLRAKMALQPEMVAKPIWITEIGFNTAYKAPGAVGNEWIKADYLVNTMNKLRANGITYPINWFNFSHNVNDVSSMGYDLIRKDSATLQTNYLPAYYAYRDLWTSNPPITNPPVPPGATTTTFPAMADTYVDSASPGTSYGTTTKLTVNGSPLAVTYIKFDLASLAGKTLDVIRLKIKTAPNSDAGSTSQHFLKTCDTAWDEATMNYNNRAALSFYTLGGGIMNTTYNTWYELDLYQPDIQPKAGQNLCLALIGDGTNGLNINSRETADKPQLIVTHHPAQGGPTIYAADLFGRSVTDGWGSAQAGGAYTLSGTAPNFDANGSAGTIALPAPNTLRSAYLSSVSALDVDITFRVQTDKLAVGGSQIAYVVARRVSNGTEYHGRIRFATNGQLMLQGEQVVAGTTTLLGSERAVPGVTHTTNKPIWVRAQVVGTNPTTIRIKGWADGQAEPTTWQYSVTNTAASLQAPGAVGLQAYLSSANNAPVLFTFDDFRVTSVAVP